MKYAIEIKNLNFKYDDFIFENLNVSFEKGLHYGISGKSGVGKSSLFNLILGLELAQSGSISILDKQLNPKNITAIRQQIAWLPQWLNEIGVGTCFDTIMRVFDYEANADKQTSLVKIKNLFDAFDLDYELLERQYSDLSGGEKQRIGLIICLLLDRPIILLDEPSSALDEKLIQKALDLLSTLKDKKNISIISISHNSQWLSSCDKVYEIDNKTMSEVSK